MSTLQKEELNFSVPQFKGTMIPGKFQSSMRHCLLLQLVRISFFGLRSIGIVVLNIKNEHEVPNANASK
jgi:hypothetical protein